MHELTAIFLCLLLAASGNAQSNGLTGHYFANETLLGEPVATRIDPQINFVWLAAPTQVPGMPANSYSVRWTGGVSPPTSELYTLHVTISQNDGARLFIDSNRNGQFEEIAEEKLIDEIAMGTQPQTFDRSIEWEAGNSYGIRLDFFEHQSTAQIRLQWSSATIPRQVIPMAQLTSEIPQIPEPSTAIMCLLAIALAVFRCRRIL